MPMPSGELYRQVNRTEEDFYNDDPEDGPTEENARDLEWLVASKFTAADIQDNWNPRDSNSLIYEPLKVEGLHREFAAMDLSSEGVLKFAKKYGFLGFMTWEVWRIEPRADYLYAEWVGDWISIAWVFRRLVALWDLLRDPESSDEEIGKYLEYDCEGAWLKVFFDADEINDPVYDQIKTFWGYPYEAVVPYLPPEIASESFERRRAREVLRAVVGEIVRSESVLMIGVGGGDMTPVPKNLIAAIYISFARELMGKTQTTAKCVNCGKWFRPKHAARIYCSDACKMKAYRRSKKAAT